MKNILLSTDLSQDDYNTALYAAEMARFTGARLILFHAYRTNLTFLQEGASSDTCLNERQAQAKLDRIAKALHKMYGISITRLLKPGFTQDELPVLAQKTRANVVVTGMNKPDTVTVPILEKVKVPVLCLPQNSLFEPIRKILLFREEPSFQLNNAYEWLVSFASNIKAELIHAHAVPQMAVTAPGGAVGSTEAEMSFAAIPALLPAETVGTYTLSEASQLIALQADTAQNACKLIYQLTSQAETARPVLFLK
ncbi:universal stress protein [Pontibacter sp. SGAir0037]|uniref:universal stress protein n=1 Tax=Pontibacter sp. SGAir0037 TaxID=2571030 RepID=UPI0010CD224F|nr:universal stress protein [Pontibacter sp. SGAir0037]QCR21484.1 hypothetical protein C1N53_03395 [Pontibacter sp. SGAir0037]